MFVDVTESHMSEVSLWWDFYHCSFLKYMKVPRPLSAASIIKDQLLTVFSSMFSESDSNSVNEESPIAPEVSELKRYVHDMVLCCTIMGVNITPWLLDSLIGKVKDLFSQLPPVVPNEFYLPAPPVYCPQPALPAEVRDRCTWNLIMIAVEVYILFLLDSSPASF